MGGLRQRERTLPIPGQAIERVQQKLGFFGLYNKQQEMKGSRYLLLAKGRKPCYNNGAYAAIWKGGVRSCR